LRRIVDSAFAGIRSQDGQRASETLRELGNCLA
jgi:hypothetical protein